MSLKIAIIAALTIATMALLPAQAQQAPSGGQQQQQTTPPPKPPEPPPQPPKDPPPKPSNNFSPQGRTFGPDNGANIRP